MKKWLAGIMSVLLVTVLAACSSSGGGKASGGGDNVVIAYNNPPEWANWEKIHESFQKAAGVRVPPDNKNSGQALTALISEKDNPIADVVYYGIVFGPQAVEKDLVEGYKPPHFDEIPDELKDPDGKWMTLHYGAIAFIVNTDVLGNTPVPTSWEDLLKPEYKGKVGFLDPTSAAVGYSVITAANLAMGGTLDDWDKGIDYLKRLEANGAIHPKQTANAKVMKGEIPILIDADFNGYKMKHNDNAPIEVVIPAEGSLKIPYVISLVKNAPHEENAKKYLDYLLSDEGQSLFADGFVQPIRNVDIPQETKEKFLPDSDYERAMNVDFIKMNDVQDNAIERWKNEVVSGN